MTQDSQGKLVVGGLFPEIAGTSVRSNIAWSELQDLGIGLPFVGNNELMLWIKSDAGTSCMTHHCNLTSWTDISGKGRHASVTLGTNGYVTYDTQNLINFNPTVHLNTARLNFTTPTALSNYTAFFVLKSAQISDEPLLME